MLITRDPEISLLAQQQLGQTLRPSGGAVFGAAVREGFHMTSLVALRDTFRMSSLAAGAEETRLDEAEWKASPSFRPGLEWWEGITEDQAKILAERFDQKKRSDWVLSRSEGHLGAMIGGMLVGGIPDPLNFIPFLGSFRALGWANRIGRTAAEAAIGAAATEPLLFTQADAFQEDHDLRMAITNIAAATAIGAGFGVLGKTLSTIPITRRAQATHKAATDYAAGRRIDVEAALAGDRVAEANNQVALALDPLASRLEQEQLDFTVLPERAAFEEAAEPPTRGKFDNAPPDPEDVRQLELRIKELGDDLDDADKAFLAAGDEEAARKLKAADAWEAAAACLTA